MPANSIAVASLPSCGWSQILLESVTIVNMFLIPHWMGTFCNPSALQIFIFWMRPKLSLFNASQSFQTVKKH